MLKNDGLVQREVHRAKFGRGSKKVLGQEVRAPDRNQQQSRKRTE